jgi:hypothetical protein
MATFNFLITESMLIHTSSAGAGMTISTKNNFPRALVMFYQEFEKRSYDILQKNGCGLCHELARYSMPARNGGTPIQANDAVLKYAQENKALANVAYKPWENRSPEFWVMSGYYTVAEHVLKVGLNFQNPTFQRLAGHGKWDLLYQLMVRKGFTEPQDAPKARFVKDSAKLRDFIWWKSQYKKNPRTHNYYVKDKNSILRMSNESSLNNYASIVINGWLNASKQLGDVVPSGVQFIKWRHGKGLGWGSGKIQKVERGHHSMKIENKFANMNGVFDSSIQQTMFRRRMQMLDADTKKLFKDMPDYWKSLKI